METSLQGQQEKENNILKRINAQGWTLNLNWSDKKMNQCFGLQYTVFSHLSLASNMVQVIEGKNKYKRSQGK